MAKSIIFKRTGPSGATNDSLVDKLRAAARAEQWVGTNGLKAWAKERYNATLRQGKYGDWTSILFKTDDDMAKFKDDFDVVELKQIRGWNGKDPDVPMNPLVHNLMMDALHKTFNGPDPDDDINRLYVPNEFIKNFAELIVNECVAVCDAYGMPDNTSQTALVLSAAIKSKFGVK